MSPRNVERSQPRISVNKLGEYMVASPARRRQIIVEQKRPKDFMVMYYSDAQVPIIDYLSNSGRDPLQLVRAMESLDRTVPTSDWDETRLSVCAEALESFLEIAETLDLDGLNVVRGTASPEHLNKEGVLISVRPELVVTRRERGPTGRGAMKLWFAKNDPLTQEAANYIATVLQEYVELILPGEQPVDRRLCLVVDVFAKRVFEAPRAVTRRRRDIEAACQEIRRAWQEV